jgi:short-subunit dehydrogenase
MTNTDQIVLVTGASSGIGKAISLALADQGTAMCLVGRNLGKLEAVAEDVRLSASIAHCILADLEKEEDIIDLVEHVDNYVGQVDILIHCAGCIALGAIETADISELDRQYKINIRAPYLLTQLFLPALRAQHGQIVFVNSSAGQTASANAGQYAATKHALRAIADSLRKEVNSYGIRVLSVYPGRTATPMQGAIHEVEGKTYNPERLMQPNDVAAVVVNALKLSRTAEVTDVHVRPFLKT